MCVSTVWSLSMVWRERGRERGERGGSQRACDVSPPTPRRAGGVGAGRDRARLSLICVIVYLEVL